MKFGGLISDEDSRRREVQNLADLSRGGSFNQSSFVHFKKKIV